MGVLRSGARGIMPATAKRLASWRVLKEMLQSSVRRCFLLDVLESFTVGTCVQHFFQVLSRGGGPLAQVSAYPGHNFFFPCPILRFACPVFVDKCKQPIGHEVLAMSGNARNTGLFRLWHFKCCPNFCPSESWQSESILRKMKSVAATPFSTFREKV